MTSSHHTRPGPAIVTRGLTRHFTRKKTTVEAVRGLDLEIGRGELVAFLGPNGAGKSTTLRMLTTLIPPTSGTALVEGYDVVRDQRDVRRHIGYVGQGNGAGQQQRGRDELVSQGRAYGLNRADARHPRRPADRGAGPDEVADRVVSTLSGGQRRRLDVALGLVHDPGLLFLDEPSTGLDPQNRVNLQEQIRRLHAERGTTIVLTTHYLEEADALAERVVVIDHGLVIADDTAARLKSSLGDRITMTFGDAGQAGLAAERVGRRADATVTRDGTVVRLRAPHGSEQAAWIVTDLAEVGAPVQRLEVVGPTLDDVFLDLTGRSLREVGSADPTATTDPTPPLSKEPQHEHPATLVTDTANVLTRELKPLLREPFGMLISLMQPLVFLALFAPLLPDMGPTTSALQWFVPGIVAMSCLMGSSMVGASLMQEMFTGSHERLLVSPLSRTSLLVGRALREIVPVLAQTTLILAIVTPFSFDLHPAGVLVGIAILGVFCIGVGALSFALALASKDQDWVFWTVQQTVIFPMLLLAGMLLPIEGARAGCGSSPSSTR